MAGSPGFVVRVMDSAGVVDYPGTGFDATMSLNRGRDLRFNRMVTVQSCFGMRFGSINLGGWGKSGDFTKALSIYIRRN